MKKIKTYMDIFMIIENKLDVKDDLNKTIPFIILLNMKLIDIHTIIMNGEWTYQTL